VSTAEVRPALFASAQIRVKAVPMRGGGAVAEISFAGIVLTIDENEGRALCTALRDAFGLTPTVTTRAEVPR
jgi:hypothetical protein